jgi:hypothetical protein
MINVKHAILGVAATAAIAVLPMASAMANGHGFRPAHGFGVGHGLLGAAVALATLPLVVASNVLAGVSESAAPYQSPGYPGSSYAYAPPVAYAPARSYYAPHPGYYAAPGAVYGPRPYYRGHPGYDGRGYYRSGAYTYPRR